MLYPGADPATFDSVPVIMDQALALPLKLLYLPNAGSRSHVSLGHARTLLTTECMARRRSTWCYVHTGLQPPRLQKSRIREIEFPGTMGPGIVLL
jgi:hypothetical protein